MAKPIPTLGYPTRTAAVAALAKQGKSFPEIADLVGITVKQAQNLYYDANNWRYERIKVHLRRDLLDGFAQHARKRGINAHELAERILKVIQDDNLVDAILDDMIVREAA
jgi:hypothetical protein